MLGPFLQLAPADDVAVAIRKIPAGTRSAHSRPATRSRWRTRSPCTRSRRCQVRKFGVPIGRATRDIAAGELVHVQPRERLPLINDVDHFEE